MNRAFPLGGLLRLRKLEEDATAADLAVARIRVDEVREREALVRAALGSEATPTTAPNSALHAIAAARASARNMLAELNAIAGERAGEADRAAESHARAKAAAGALEKLSDRHAALVGEEDQRQEQVLLDEIASRSARHRADAHAGGQA